MNASELSKYIGKTGLLTVFKTLRVPVSINDARSQFGRTDLLVTPVGGTGEKWVSHEAVKLTKQ